MITKYDLGFADVFTYKEDHEVFVKIFETFPYLTTTEYIIFENFYIYKDGQYRFVIKNNNFSIINIIDYNYIFATYQTFVEHHKDLEDKRDEIRKIISDNKIIPIGELPDIRSDIDEIDEHRRILEETIRKQKLKRLLCN